MDQDGSQSSEPDPARRLRRVAFALATGLVLGAGSVAAAAPNAIRMPEGEFGSESWDWVAHLDGGSFVLAQAVLSNLGPGDRHAAVLGHLVGADGSVRNFKRSEPEGKWKLAEAGRRLDLRSIALEPFGPTPRFEVAKDELGLELVLRGESLPVHATDAGACAFELLAASAPATARLRVGAGSAWRSTPARVALTHRRSTALESACVERRVELFVLEHGVGVYFSETTAPDGRVTRQLVAERDGKVVHAGDLGDASVEWSAASGGFAPPASARFAAAGVSGAARFGAELASVDPTDRLPAALQWIVAARTRPRISWLRAPVDLTIGGRSLSGEGIAKVTYSNPSSGGRVPARVAAHSEE